MIVFKWFLNFKWNEIFIIDRYSLVRVSDGKTVKINEKGIAWPNDVGKKFKRTKDSNLKQWIDPEDGNLLISFVQFL